MANDKPSYKQVRENRLGDPQNASRVVVEGVEEPAKSFAARMPKDYKSADVEDRRNEPKSKDYPSEQIFAGQ